MSAHVLIKTIRVYSLQISFVLPSQGGTSTPEPLLLVLYGSLYHHRLSLIIKLPLQMPHDFLALWYLHYISCLYASFSLLLWRKHLGPKRSSSFLGGHNIGPKSKKWRGLDAYKGMAHVNTPRDLSEKHLVRSRPISDRKRVPNYMERLIMYNNPKCIRCVTLRGLQSMLNHELAQQKHDIIKHNHCYFHSPSDAMIMITNKITIKSFTTVQNIKN